MKIAVYTIVKDAAPYIANWIESAKDADYLILGDTGSSDRTVAIARKLGATVYKVQPEVPFHFGNARNAILAKVPADADACVVLDADEVLESGWREALEANWNGSLMSVDWHDGRTAAHCWLPRIHARNAYWVDRIHEYIVVPNATAEKSGVVVTHNKDLDRDRNYLELLQLQLRESPSPRTLALIGKELAARGRRAEAIDHLEQYLVSDSDFMQERASVCNTLYYLTTNPEWLYKSIWYCPPQREAYSRLAEYMVHNNDWIGAYHYASMSLEYEPLDLFSERCLTDEAIHAILAESAYQTGRQSEATATAGWLVENYPANSGHSLNLARYHGG